MKKTINILLAFIIAFTFTNAISSKALAAAATTTIGVSQYTSKPSSTIFIKKDAKISVVNQSTGNRKINVSLVNSQTKKVVSTKAVANTNNQVVTPFNLKSLPAGNYHVVITCPTQTSCKGAATLYGN